MMKSAYEYLTTILHEFAGIAAQTAAYGWSDDFARKEIKEVWSDQGDVLRKARGRRVTVAELQALAPEQLYQLGFGNWDGNLVLIPLWAKNYIDQDEIVISISGDTSTLREADTDVRFSCIAYGFPKIKSEAA